MSRGSLAAQSEAVGPNEWAEGGREVLLEALGSGDVGFIPSAAVNSHSSMGSLSPRRPGTCEAEFANAC